MPTKKSPYHQLFKLLNQGEKLTGSAAAVRLGVSQRTIQRALERGRKEGIPIASEQDGHEKAFFIPEEDREAGMWISLDQNELLALMVAADASHGTLARTPLGPPLTEAIRKLVEQMPEQLTTIEPEESDLYWHFSGTPASEIDPDVFRDLVAAVRDCAVIVVDYFSASSGHLRPNRPLDPYALAVQGGSWILVAWCHWKRTFLDFSISAITNLRRNGSNFLRREEFDLENHFRGRFRSIGGKQAYTVRFSVTPNCVPYFKRKRYHPSQKLIEQPDGSGLVEFTVFGLEDIRSFAQSWGVGITVLEPPELVEIMRRQACELAARYNEN